MKVTVAVTIDVDAQAWAKEFGTATGQTAIRNDIVEFYAEGIKTDLIDRGLQKKTKR